MTTFRAHLGRLWRFTGNVFTVNADHTVPTAVYFNNLFDLISHPLIIQFIHLIPLTQAHII